MSEFYLRKNDPFLPVYEVDYVAQTWRLVASKFGVLDMGGSIETDDGQVFKGDGYCQVWMKSDNEGVVTFTRECPEIAGEQNE